MTRRPGELAELLDAAALVVAEAAAARVRRNGAAPIGRLLDMRRALRAAARDERKRSPQLPGWPPTSLREFARQHEIPESTARRLATNGEIPGAVRVGGTWIVPAGATVPRPEHTTRTKTNELDDQEATG